MQTSLCPSSWPVIAITANICHTPTLHANFGLSSASASASWVFCMRRSSSVAVTWIIRRLCHVGAPPDVLMLTHLCKLGRTDKMGLQASDPQCCA